MKRGKLVVFEGISGTGKETQAKLLKEFLETKGIKSIIVYHPSPELKEIISTWRKTRLINNVSEVYFLLADRYNKVEEVIKPALARGEWVISLRSFVSALVYQGKTVRERDWIASEFQKFEPKPDYLFWFDIMPEKALERIKRRHQETGEPLGKFETPKYLNEKRKSYQRVFKNIPHQRLNVSQGVQAIYEEICSQIKY